MSTSSSNVADTTKGYLGFEDVSASVGIKVDAKTTGGKVDILEAQPDAIIPPTGAAALDNWRIPVMRALGVRRAARGRQLRPAMFCEPLCGMLPGTTSAKAPVFSLPIF